MPADVFDIVCPNTTLLSSGLTFSLQNADTSRMTDLSLSILMPCVIFQVRVKIVLSSKTVLYNHFKSNRR